MTRIWSALRTVDSRWAITSEVRPSSAASRARCTAASDSLSRWAVASSRMTIEGDLQQQPGDRDAAAARRRRAGSRARRRRCPARRAAPATSGRDLGAPPAPPTSPRRSRRAGRSAGCRAIVSWNRWASWVTKPTASSQRLQRHVAHVGAAERGRRRRRRRRAGRPAAHGGLAGAGGTHQRDHLPGLGDEGDVVEHRPCARATRPARDRLQGRQRDLVGARVGEVGRGRTRSPARRWRQAGPRRASPGSSRAGRAPRRPARS